MTTKINILVVGDIMLDEYVMGSSSRLSPEAPIPVVDVDTIKYRLGGAANVANNLKSIGVETLLWGLVGDDSAGDDIKDMLEEGDLNTVGIITDEDRRTTRKTRVISSNNQIVRYDIEDRTEYEGNKLINYIGMIEPSWCNAIIISDYGKGVITSKLMSFIRNHFKNIPIIVDPNINNYIYYRDNVDMITPNYNEAQALYESTNLDETAERLLDFVNCEYVLITKGKDGMSLYNALGAEHIETDAQSVYDVSGAGDTVTAVFAVGLCQGMTPKNAAIMSNKAAGIVVGDLGTSVVGDRLWKN